MAESNEPMTPAGRLFLQDEMNQVINSVIITEHPLPSIEMIKNEIKNSIMVKHPRFRSLMVKDSSGREHWGSTEIDIDRHLVVHHRRISDETDEDAVNGYLAELSYSSPLSTDKPLWEIHVLVEHKALVFRLHHALGDGVSLMSMLLSCCRKVEDPTKPPTLPGGGGGTVRKWGMRTLVNVVFFTLVYVFELVIRFWLPDKTTVLTGGAGVEHWPRLLATARFRLDDMKKVLQAVSGATINDVLFGVISRGFSWYVDIRSPKGLVDGTQITGVAMMNLRQQPQFQDLVKQIQNGELGIEWGNKFGMIMLPVYYQNHEPYPLNSVKKAKEMIDRKKLSLEGLFSHKLLHFITALFGPKVASILNYRLVCNTTFTISNIVGPKERISICGNPLKYMRVTSSSLPHAITMHMLSYAGYADMQILVAKEVIPDPKFLALCFENALLEMKEAAESYVMNTLYNKSV